MKISLICFTLNGYILAEKIKDVLSASPDEAVVYTKSRYLGEDSGIPVKVPLKEWAGQMFESCDALIFVGALGICVRAIAPFVSSKKHDPAVVVLDEQGKHCISLLSGHLGGANELVLRLCGALGCDPVITTATDINGIFAVDVFAKKNALEISDMALAKEVSAKLLAGERVGFKSEFPVRGRLPEGLAKEDENTELGIYVGIHNVRSPFKKTLFLTAKAVCAGAGCKKGKEKESIEALFNEVLLAEGIDERALFAVASADLKKDEEGLKAFAAQRKVPFETYSAAQLLEAKGDFTSSEFVRSVAGVDNVCERAAVLSSGNGTLIRKKTARSGVTLALALKEKEISFE